MQYVKQNKLFLFVITRLEFEYNSYYILLLYYARLYIYIYYIMVVSIIKVYKLILIKVKFFFK